MCCVGNFSFIFSKKKIKLSLSAIMKEKPAKSRFLPALPEMSKGGTLCRPMPHTFSLACV